MATYTPNLNLKKPLTGEPYDVISVHNDAMDKLDIAAGNNTSQLAEKAAQSELLQAKSQIDSFVVEAATGMTDAGSLELVATRTDKDGYAHLTAPRRVDVIEKSLTDLEIYALIGDNHIDAESYIGTGINTLNTKIIKLPKGVTLKNNTAYKLYVKLADGTFPNASTVVQFCKADGTVITGPGFNASFSSAILSQTVYLKFTVYGGAGTVNISEIALVLNGKVYTPFTLAYKSKKVEELVATKSSLVGAIINLYDPLKVVKGFFDTGTGVISGTSDNYKLVYIPCNPNTTYTVRKTIGTFFAVGTSTVIPAAAGTVTPIATSHTAGSITVTTPANAAYLCANVWNLYTDTSITADAMLASIVITPDLGNEYPANSIYLGTQMIAKEENLSKEVRDLLHSTNPSNWNGKKWISYGDSVTQAGLWQPFITDEFDFAGFEKSGIGGTTVSNANPTDYFCKDTRLATIVMTNPDMVLIMGGTNDHGYNVPIGTTAYPYVESTFKGGLCSTVIKMMAKFPSARIILASPLSGRGNEAGVNMTAPVLNGLGLSTEDYANAVKEVAHFLSIPYIDMYGKTGINQFNRATYLSDTVHPNLAGQKRMAEVAIGELKLINPIA